MWTESQLRMYIRQALRSIWFMHPVHLNALAAVKREEPWIKKDGTRRMRRDRKTKELVPANLSFYKCAGCEQEFKMKDVRVDHVKPVGPSPGTKSADGKVTWDEVIERMLGFDVQVQVLCEKCHIVKTEKDKDLIRAGKWR